VALANLGQPEEAVRAFDEALVIDPRDPGTWHNKGLALAKIGREVEAIDCFSHYRDLTGDRPSGDSRRRPFR
jgi:Flp pilus assembly protein TadD